MDLEERASDPVTLIRVMAIADSSALVLFPALPPAAPAATVYLCFPCSRQPLDHLT